MSLEINIQNPKTFKAHRSGWGFVIQKLMSLHNSSGIYFDDFLDITFGYNRNKNIDKKNIPYKKPWMGVIHHPPNICPWYEQSYRTRIDIHTFLNEPEFLISLEKCEGLIVLSNYLKKYLYDNFQQLKKIPIIVVKHPTEPGELEWSFDKFKKASSAYGLKILNIGYFLRNMTSIYHLKSNRKLDKYLMPSDMRYGLNNLSLELKYKNLSYIDKNSIKILNWQENSFYDKLLEQSLVFLDLYDTSCNNAIIESIIRGTPLLINKHPAIEEYLGSDYPLYYNNIQETSNLINYDTIYEAHKYLINNKNNQFKYLNSEYFLDDFKSQINYITSKQKISSKIYKKQNTRILTQPSLLKHRYGWPYVTEQLSSFYKKHNNKLNKNCDKLVINNFLEHTFKNDSKTIIFNNKKYIVNRGYNLFTGLNSDIIYIDNKYYIWNKNNWIPYNNHKFISELCDMNRVSTYKNNPWIGIAHNPINMPIWFDYTQNINTIINNNDFIDSLTHCKCIITLSEDLKQNMGELFNKYHIKTPIISTLHPVPDIKCKKFNMKMFLDRGSILQIGYWLRNMHSFWQLSTNLEKIWLYGDNYAGQMIGIENILEKDNKKILQNSDIETIKHSIENNDSVNVRNVRLARINMSQYDTLLSSSIAFVNLRAASANNAIIDCLRSATPILVNKLDTVIEYLGPKYPLYYKSIEHASQLCSDNDLILEAHEYLVKQYESLKEKLSINNWISFIDRQINKYAKNN